MPRVCYLFCAVLCFGLFPLPVLAGDTDTLEKFFGSLQTLQANFQQKLYAADNSLLEQSSGNMILKRPGRFRWQYTEPFKQLIITDGKEIWIYDPDLEQATLKKFDSAVEDSPALLLSGGQEIKDSFDVLVLEKNDQNQWYQLTPKDSESQFRWIHLELRGDVLEKLILFDNLGQSSEIQFSAQIANKALDDSEFSFVPPSGSDIIDGRE